MIWTNKNWLFGLWLLPIAVFLLRRAAVKAREQIAAFADPEMARRLAPARSGARELIRGSLIVAGLAFLLIAAAGPRGAGELAQVEKKGADVVILLDISRSMLADDTKPNRLESAKLDILDLLERGEGDRFGLVLFAGKPLVKIPLTSDRGFFEEALKSVSVSDAPRGGTGIGAAIRMALRGETDPSRDRAILLITDGEDHESDAMSAAGEAAGLGVRIFTVAMGDAETGGRIPLYDPQGNLTGYQMYQGEEIRTKTDRELLRQIAEKTGGAFLDMGKTPTNLGAFYSKSVRLKRAGYAGRQRRVWKEEYQPFLLAGLLLVCGGYGISPCRAAVPLALAVCLALFSGGRVCPAQEGNDFPADRAALSSAEEATTGAEPIPGAEDSADRSAGLPAASRAADPNLGARDLYNRACELAAGGDEDAALAHLEEALKKTESMKHAGKLRGKILYKMGVLRTHELQRRSDQLKTESAPEGAAADPSVPGAPSAPPAAIPLGREGAGPKPDLLDAYRKDAARRAAARQKIADETEQVIDLFRRAGGEGERSVSENASRARDLLYSWAQGEDRAFRRREREIRENTFEPADQIRWLLDGLTELREQEELESPPEQPRGWQRLYTLGGEAKERAADLNSLLEQGRFRGDEEPEKSAARLDDLESASAALAEASGKIAEEPETARDALRAALAAIDRAGLTDKEYPDIVMDALARQEEIVKQAESLVPRPPEEEKEKPAEDKQDGRRVISRGTLLDRGAAVMRRTARMMSDADQEFQQRPWTGEEPAEAAGDGETEPPSGEEFFAEPSGISGDAPPQAEGLSPEEKIRLSMKRALESGPEIEEESRALSALSADRFPAEASPHEARILDLLRRIAEPLQEDQDQNQQDQQDQQDQNRESQNSQDQNPQSGSSQNQDGQGEENQPPQSSGDPNDQQEPQGGPSSPETEEPRDEDRQDGEVPETAEEEEARRNEEKAESMMRKVEQRQQDAEEYRRAREALFHRYEKPEKDW